MPVRVTPDQWKEVRKIACARMFHEWRPGQVEAWRLFEKAEGQVALISGRRVGKTFNALRFAWYKMMTEPGLSVAFVSKTFGEAVEMAFDDPHIGLLRLLPPEAFAKIDRARGVAELPNGSTIKLYGGRDPNKARGRGFRLIIFDEPAFYMGGWEVISNLVIAFDVRKQKKGEASAAEQKRTIIYTTTPMRNIITKKILENTAGRMLRVPTRAIYDYLDPDSKREYDSLINTPFGRREYNAEVVWEGDQAIMTQDQVTTAIQRGMEVVADARADEQAARSQGLGYEPPWSNVIVSVDHAVGDEDKEERSRSGILVCAKYHPEWVADPFFIVLADYSASGRSEDWIPAAIQAYHQWNAGEMTVETNQGGNLIKTSIHHYDKSINVYGIHSHLAKEDRAVIAQTLAGQGRVMFAKDFPELGDELMSFKSKRRPKDPHNDRADAFAQAARRIMHPAELVLNAAPDHYAAANHAPAGYGDNNRAPSGYGG